VRLFRFMRRKRSWKRGSERGPIVRGHCWSDPEYLEDLRFILRVILLSVQYARGLESENQATAINYFAYNLPKFTVHCARVQQGLWRYASAVERFDPPWQQVDNAHLQPLCHGINGIKEVRSEVYVERKH
jgi:hypothetical protein